MMKKVWRWLCKNSACACAEEGRIYPGEGSSGGGRMGPSDVDWEHKWLEDGENPCSSDIGAGAIARSWV